MENKLTPKESFEIIQGIINERKQTYENNGSIILMWGILVFAAGLTQYLMLKNEMGHISYYAWLFTMIPAFIITFVSKMKEGKSQLKKSGSFDTSGLVWAFSGTCAMFTAFIFGNYTFGTTFTLLIYLPFCLAGFVTGLQLKDRLMITVSLLSVVISYASLLQPMVNQPLIAGFIGLLLMAIPGFKLMMDHKKRKNV